MRARSLTRRAVAVALLAASCGAPDTGTAADAAPAVTTTTAPAPTTSTTAPTAPSTTETTVEPEPAWVVGAELLPLRPDGLGEILPTPEPLVERSLPTQDVLPPPPTDDYVAAVAPLSDEVIARMGTAWQPGCPVELGDLRHVTLSFWGFNGGHHTGELVVHRDVADDVAWVFGQLHAARFPLEEVRIVTPADLEAPPTGDGNTTAAFVCRPVRGGTTTSAHASGLAVDVNPFNNPYVRGDIVLPERASAYLDRAWHRPGMIQAGDVVSESFAAIGWTWGGAWASPDLMHFSATGR
ncbi:MAG: M15 family metallopeptidase [Acidimicrobiia bacterium]|nr:M15 family metallopeptidase [Acidimicrobiia bacterium]